MCAVNQVQDEGRLRSGDKTTLSRVPKKRGSSVSKLMIEDGFRNDLVNSIALVYEISPMP